MKNLFRYSAVFILFTILAVMFAILSFFSMKAAQQVYDMTERAKTGDIVLDVLVVSNFIYATASVLSIVSAVILFICIIQEFMID